MLRKEKLTDWQKEKLNTKEIIIDEEKTSTVIICDSQERFLVHAHSDKVTYFNTRTGKSSKNIKEVLDVDNNNILLKSNEVVCKSGKFKGSNDNAYCGFYVVYDEEFDAVISLLCQYDADENKWKEVGREWFTAEDAYSTDESRSARIDITGNICFDCYGVASNYPVGMQKLLSKKIGPFYIKENEDEVFEERYFNKWEDIADTVEEITNANKKGVRKFVEFGTKEYCMQGINFHNEEIPDAAMSVIEDMCNKTYRFNASRDVDDTSSFSILQNFDNTYVIRNFELFYILNANRTKSETILIETLRVGLQKECADYLQLCNPTIFYADKGMENTVLRYYEKEIRNEIADSLKTTYPYDALFYVFLAVCPLVEKMYKIANSNETLKPFAKHLKYDYFMYYKEESYVKYRFGEIDESQKEFNKMLGVPKNIIKIIAENDGTVYVIKDIKSLFKYNKEYLQNMNETDLTDIVRKIVNSRISTPFLFHEKIKIVQKIAALYGNDKNILHIISFVLSKDEKGEEFDVYSEYIEKLSVIGEAAKNAEWKLCGEKLLKASKSLNAAYEVMINQQFEEQEKKFAMRYEDLLKYCYHDNEFCIIPPRHPSELIIEGMTLKHCVKDFVDGFAEGKRTILFVRKVGHEKEPFFTMEIKEDVIVQCHGKCNMNISKYGCDLAEFIKKFCEDKNIAYDNPDRLVGI